MKRTFHGNQYVRLSTVDHAGKKQTVTLRLVSEDNKFLSGHAVDKEGAVIGKKQADGPYIQQLHVVDKGTITKRTPLRMNNTYGELEPDPDVMTKGDVEGHAFHGNQWTKTSDGSYASRGSVHGR